MYDDALFDVIYRVNKKGNTVRRKNWERRLKKFDQLTGLVKDDSPQDSFNISFGLADTGNVITEISVTDSITDFTYTGGDSLTLTFFGSWREQKQNGTWRTKSKSFGIVLDSKGPFDATETYTVGSNQLNSIFDNASNVQYTLTGSDDETIFSGSVFVADFSA